MHEEIAENTGLGIVPEEKVLEIGRQKVAERIAKSEARRREKGGPSHTIPKTLIIVAGHEGSGKSKATRLIDELAQVVVVDKDPLHNEISPTRGEHDDPVHKAMRPLIYKTMYALADEHLKNGSVILDAPFDKDEDFFHNGDWIKKMEELAFKHKAQIKVVWCVASPEVKEARMKKRANPQDKRRTPEELKKLASKTSKPNFTFPHLEYDTELPDGEEKTAALVNFLEMEEIPREESEVLTEIPVESTIA